MRLAGSCFGLLSAGLITVGLANPPTEKTGWHWPAQTKQVRVYQEEGVDEDDYGVFYQNLSSDGRWLETDDYGYVFQPNDADSSDWGPYRSGHWVWTDYGWYWQSDESYGWACYHYGRWVRILGVGWVWVPGREWGPAWVSWRQSDDYCGWAPLPPECSVSVGFSIGGWCDNYYGIGPAAYCFIHFGDWFRPNYYHYCAPGGQNFAIIQRTVNVTNVYRTNNFFVNNGPQSAIVSQRAGAPITRYNINYIAQNNGHYRTAVQGNQLNVVAPAQVLKASASGQPTVARTLGNAQVDKGWQGVPPSQATALKQQFATQHAVPANLPSNPQYTQKAVLTQANKNSSANTQPPNLIKPFNQNTPAQTSQRTVGTTNGQTLSNVPPGTVTKRFSETQTNEPLNKSTQAPGTVDVNRKQNGPNGPSVPTKAFTKTVEKNQATTSNFVDQTKVPVAQPTPPPNSNHASTVQHSNTTVRKPEVQKFSQTSTPNYVQSTKTNQHSESVYHAPADTTQVYHPQVNTYHPPVNTYHPPATTYHPSVNNYHSPPNAYHAPANAGHPPTSQPHSNNGGNKGGGNGGKDKKK